MMCSSPPRSPTPTAVEVTLQLQLDPAEYISLADPAYASMDHIPMNDGVNGGLVVDDTFCVTLDAATYQVRRRLVRYLIVAHGWLERGPLPSLRG